MNSIYILIVCEKKIMNSIYIVMNSIYILLVSAKKIMHSIYIVTFEKKKNSV